MIITLTLAMGTIILTFQLLINVLSNWKLVSRFLPALACVCNFSRKVLHLSMIGVNFHHIWLCLTIFKISGDIEENPDHKCTSNQSFFFIFNWNFNIITARNCLKISLLRVYISFHHFNVVRISETYLDSTQCVIIKIWKLLDIACI